MRDRDEERRRTIRILTFVGAGILIAAILWIDIATGIWQELVILAGLAAGLVSFLLTALVLNRIVARDSARRWAPVNRLAISEFLHAIADNERSAIAHGVVVPRTLPDTRGWLTDDTDTTNEVAGPVDSADLTAQLNSLREAVAVERRDLSKALGRWADFLTTSGDNERILGHIADIAFQLDAVRDTALEVEAAPDAAGRAQLQRDVDGCNARFAALVEELQQRLANDRPHESRSDEARAHHAP